jgi:hypothetical protein
MSRNIYTKFSLVIQTVITGEDIRYISIVFYCPIVFQIVGIMLLEEKTFPMTIEWIYIGTETEQFLLHRILI